MERLHVGIPGLDLVLGGGIPMVHREDDGLPSAILLLRGPPGSGKSVFGTQLAGAAARELGCDVAYGCIEILPQEVREQHASFSRAGESVLVSPFPKQEPPEKGKCRMFTALLDFGETETEADAASKRAGFGGAIIELLDVVTEVGGDPRVLVIDSLSDGYGLGASVPRILADQLCKVAVERGMILILMEETVDGRPSPWSFASDVVLGLEVQAEDQPPDMPAPFERRFTVLKNRFAGSDAGPHRFTIEQERGVVLFPRPAAYLTRWANDIVLPAKPPNLARSWNLPHDILSKLPEFNRSVTAVYGSDPAYVFRTAATLGGLGSDVDVLIDFGHSSPLGAHERHVTVSAAADPFLSGNRLLADAVQVLDDIIRHRGVRRVLVGDFRSLRTYWDPDGIRRAVAVLVALLRRVEIPVVLFETTSGMSIAAAIALGPQGDFVTNNEEPSIVDLADVHIEIVVVGQARAFVTDVRGGRRHLLQLTSLTA